VVLLVAVSVPLSELVLLTELPLRPLSVLGSDMTELLLLLLLVVLLVEDISWRWSANTKRELLADG
jgi:hypothetical protein